MRILVTGAGGFIGRHLCLHLVGNGHVVSAVSSSVAVAQGMSSAIEAGRVKSLPVPARAYDVRAWAEVCCDVDIVVHLAGRAHMQGEQGSAYDDLYHRENVDRTVLLAEGAIKAGVRRFVFISSIGVNGNATANAPFRHDDKPAPYDAYSRSKLAAELALCRLLEASICELVIVRPPLVHGVGVKGNLLSLLHLVAKEWPLPFGSVNNKRSYVGVGNLVDFIERSCCHPRASGHTFLLSDGTDVSTKEVIQILADGLGVQCRLVKVPRGALNSIASLVGKRQQIEKLCSNLQVDSGLAHEILEWTPKISLQAGMTEMARWYRSHLMQPRVRMRV